MVTRSIVQTWREIDLNAKVDGDWINRQNEQIVYITFCMADSCDLSCFWIANLKTDKFLLMALKN